MPYSVTLHDRCVTHMVHRPLHNTLKCEATNIVRVERVERVECVWGGGGGGGQ